MVNSNKLKIFSIILILNLFSGCSICNWCNENYSNCQDNLVEAKENLDFCNNTLGKKKEKLENQSDVIVQLKNNETHIINNMEFEIVKKRYLNENYFLFFSYETVINIIFVFQLVFSLSFPFIIKIGKNKIVIYSITSFSFLMSFIVRGLL